MNLGTKDTLFKADMQSYVCKQTWFKVDNLMMAITELYILMLVLMFFAFIQGHRVWESTTSASIIAQNFELIVMKFGMLFRLVMINFILLLYLIQPIYKVENPI